MYNLEAEKSPLFLLLNNIDGPGLRNGKAQAILARLAEIQHIHLVASLDHANMPLCKFYFFHLVKRAYNHISTSLSRMNLITNLVVVQQQIN